MPLYEFECQHCRKISEFLMKLSDQPPTTCVHCSQGPMRKVVSKTNFVLKGQGWYETDFKGPKKPENSESASTSSKSSSPAAASSDAASTSSAEPAPVAAKPASAD